MSDVGNVFQNRKTYLKEETDKLRLKNVMSINTSCFETGCLPFTDCLLSGNLMSNLASVQQKSIPSTVVYYYCAWSWTIFILDS